MPSQERRGGGGGPGKGKGLQTAAEREGQSGRERAEVSSPGVPRVCRAQQQSLL